MKEPDQPRPRIYVACLAAYNEGGLHGEWIDADQEPDEIREQYEEMLKNSPVPDAEEFAIHDYEGFGAYRLHEYESIDHVSRVAQGIVKHGVVFAELLDHHGSIEDAIQAIEEDYHGSWDSLGDYAESSMRDCHEIPDYLDYYIDWDSMGRDWERSGDIYSIELEGRVHVFSNC